MEKKNLTEKESMELIARMIQNTKLNLESGQGNWMLAWGTATLVASLAVGVTVLLTREMIYSWLWFLIPVIGYPLMRMITPRQPKVITFVDTVLGQVWLVIGLVAIVTPFAFGFTKHAAVLPAVEIVIVSVGLIITGLLIKFRPNVIGGCIGVVIGLLTLFSPLFLYQVGAFVVWSLVGMILPGVQLNRYIRKELERKAYV